MGFKYPFAVVEVNAKRVAATEKREQARGYTGEFWLTFSRFGAIDWGMRYLFTLLIVGTFLMAAVVRAEDKQPTSPLDFTVKDIDGKTADLSQYKGKVVLFVNVASKCGYTPQYKGLESLYKKYEDKGFVILGFPANNFKSQEPGSDEQIKQFCTSKYNVTFPMMSKISVKGDDIAPVYKLLTDEKGQVTWNFNKFLVGKDGKIIEHFDSKVKPDDEKLTSAIDSALAQ